MFQVEIDVEIFLKPKFPNQGKLTETKQFSAKSRKNKNLF